MKVRNLPNTTLRLSIKGLSPLISLWEKKKLEELGQTNPQHPPIFIIGAPRTGSTILYQALTNYFNVSYIDNLSCLFYRNLFFGMYLSNKIYKDKPHNCFKSIHGNTMKTGGLHAPSECGEFWYRWLPKDHHFIDYDEITDDMVEDIKKNIFATLNYYDKPFVFKNMNAGLRLRLIHKIYPQSKFIWTKRSILDTVKSLLKVRDSVNGNLQDWWSLMPSEYRYLKALEPIEQVAKQVYYIEKQINTDLQLFDSKNIKIIQYEDFLNNPTNVISSLNLSKDTREDAQDVSLIKPSSKNDPFKRYEKEIKYYISKLNWDDYTS